jgi:uncharacterized protein
VLWRSSIWSRVAGWRYGRSDLAHDTGLNVSVPSSTELSLGYNVRTRLEVDQVMGEMTQVLDGPAA